MKVLPYILVALLSGALLPIQGSINARLGQILPHPLQASFISFLGGTVTLLVLLLVLREGFPATSYFTENPPHLFLGGILGAFFVSVMLILIPRIGVVGVGVSVIAGQLVFSLIIDHFGLLNMNVIPVSWTRALGSVLLLSGVLLMQKWN